MLSLLEGVGREVQIDLGLARPGGAPEHLGAMCIDLGLRPLAQCDLAPNLELLKRRRLRRAELRQQQGIPEIHTAVQGTQLALEDSALDQGRKVGRLDVRVFGGEGRHSNPGVAVVFGLGLEGQLKVAQQGFRLEFGARQRCESAVDGVGIVARCRKTQRPYPLVTQGVGRLVVGLDLHEPWHCRVKRIAWVAHVVF